MADFGANGRYCIDTDGSSSLHCGLATGCHVSLSIRIESVKRFMRAIVVRHYKTESNRARNIIGWTESPPVTGWEADVERVVGVLQAENIQFDRVYSSDLTRAVNTGLFYAKNLQIPAVAADPALREINYGEVATQSKAWVEKNVPQHKRDPDFVYPNGESFFQMQQRSVRFVETLADSHSGQTLLLVVHAGVIRGLVSHFLGLDYAANLRHKTSHSYIGDFHFEGSRCTGYNELGTPSGFVRDGVIEVPVSIPAYSGSTGGPGEANTAHRTG